MRLDHLLSKEDEYARKGAPEGGGCFTVLLLRELNNESSGGDALRGNTRTHPEHDG